MNGIYLNTQEQLESVCDRAISLGRFGLDLEFIPENTFYPKLALIQLAVGKSLVLVDPLRRLDLSPLFDLVANPEVETVVHAGTQDMSILVHLSGRVPAGIFDTQIAGAFLGMGHQISYGQLVKQLFDVTLAKSESFSDWLRRPLSEKQEAYALDDVRFLLPAAERIGNRLGELGRKAWVADETRVFSDRNFWAIDPADGWHRVKRARDLKGRDLEVLKAVAAWREREAMGRDLPRRRVIDDEVLIEVARSRPKSLDELGRIRGVSRERLRASGAAILEAVVQGMQTIEPTRERLTTTRISEDGETVVEYLLFCFKAICASLSVAPAVVATRAEVESLVLDYLNGTLLFERHRLLGGWRFDAIGQRLLACLNGHLGVKMNPATRRIEFDERV